MASSGVHSGMVDEKKFITPTIPLQWYPDSTCLQLLSSIEKSIMEKIGNDGMCHGCRGEGLTGCFPLPSNMSYALSFDIDWVTVAQVSISHSPVFDL